MTATTGTGAGATPERIHVLHVDAEPERADATAARLERADDRFTVRTTTAVDGALDRLAGGDVDCVVSDFAGPETDDIDLLRTVRDHHPSLPFVLFTGAGSERVASEAFAAGATDYVRKGADGHAVLANRVAAAVETEYERARRARAMDATTEGMAIVDGNGRFVEVNDAYATIQATTPEALVGSHWTTTVPDDEADRLRAEACPATAETGSWTGESVGQRADGTTYATLLSLASLDGDGHVCVVRDINERKERDRELRRARERIELALERTDSVVFEIDLDTGTVNRHGEFEQFFDLPPESVPEWEHHLEHAVHPDDRESFRQFHRALADGERDGGVLEYRTAPAFGDVRWIRDEVHVEDDGGGRRAVGVAQDVTERKEREQALHEVTEEYEAIFENAEDSVFVVDVERTTDDVEFRFDRLNPTHEAKTGLATEDLRGKTPREVLGADLGAEVAANYRRCVETGDPITYREELPLPEGERTWRTSLTPVVVDGEVTRIVGLSRDITDQVDRERKLTAMHDVAVDLETADSVEAICERTIEASRDILSFDLSVVDLEEDGWLRKAAVSEEFRPDETADMPVEEGIAGLTYRTGESIVVDDARDHPEANPQGPFRSAVSVPLGEHGVFQAVSEESAAFDGSDRELAELLVAHTTGALDRVARERALGRERDRLNAIVEAIPEPVAHVRYEDGEPLVETVNPAFEATFGCDERAIAGRSVNDIIVPDDRRERAHAIDETNQSDGIVEREVERRTVDGRRQFLFRGRMLDCGGDTREGLGIYVDITDRKTRERDLRENQRRFEAILEDPNILVGLLDTDGTVIDANRTSLEYVDADRADVVGEPLWETPWWDDDIRPVVRQRVERAAGGEYVEYEADLTRPNGDHYAVAGVIRPVTDEDGEVVSLVISARDITARRTRDRQLNAMDRVLRHNLHNEMTVVLGSAETIAETADEEVTAHAEDILESGRKLLAVTEKQRRVVDLLSEAPELASVDVSRTVRRCVEDLRHSHPDADVALAAPDGVRASAIPKLEQAVSELVENAIVHADDPAPCIEVGVEATADHVRLRVADHGPTIPSSERAILTGEGEETPLYHGSGMGLWLVDRIVSYCDGRVVHRENEPRGNVVVVELPTAPAGSERTTMA